MSLRILTKILLMTLLLADFTTSGAANSDESKKQIVVVLRYDDYSALSPTTLESKIIKELQKYNISSTFGIIPFHGRQQVPLGQMKANILMDSVKKGSLEVALHGFNHISIRKDRNSEFYGLDVKQQLKKISKGKQYLENIFGLKISTFIPPFNSYDINTIKAIEQLNFRNLSANPLGEVDETSTQNFIPQTCNLLELRDAIKSARYISENKSVITVVYHSYDFYQVDKHKGKISYTEFCDLLQWLTAQKDISIKSIAEATESISNLGADRYSSFKPYYQLHILLPSIIKRICHIPTGLYLSRKYVYNNITSLILLNIIFYCAILIISSQVINYVKSKTFHRSNFMISLTKYSGAPILILLLILAIRDGDFGFKAALGITIVLGAYVGIWTSIVRLRTKGKSLEA